MATPKSKAYKDFAKGMNSIVGRPADAPKKRAVETFAAGVKKSTAGSKKAPAQASDGKRDIAAIRREYQDATLKADRAARSSEKSAEPHEAKASELWKEMWAQTKGMDRGEREKTRKSFRDFSDHPEAIAMNADAKGHSKKKFLSAVEAHASKRSGEDVLSNPASVLTAGLKGSSYDAALKARAQANDADTAASLAKYKAIDEKMANLPADTKATIAAHDAAIKEHTDAARAASADGDDEAKAMHKAAAKAHDDAAEAHATGHANAAELSKAAGQASTKVASLPSPDQRPGYSPRGPSAEKSESEKQEMKDRAGIREMKGRENMASLSAGDLKAKAAAQEAKTPGGSERRMKIQDEPSATPAKEPTMSLGDKASTKAGQALLDQANVHSATARRHEAEGRHEEAKKSHAMAADLKKKSDAVLGVGKKEAAPAAAPAKPSGMSGADKKAMHLSNSLKEQAGGFANMAKQHAAAGRTKEAAAAMAKSKSLVAQSQKVLGSGGAHPAEAQPKNLQTGKKGGQFYVTATGQKVYLGKKGG